MKKDTPMLMMIGVYCPPGSEAQMEKWFVEKHIPGVRKFPKVKSSRFCRVANATEGGNPAYLVIHEFESAQALEEYYASPLRAAVLADWTDSWASKGAKVMLRIHCDALKNW